MILKTDFFVGDIPHREYPRPQFVRDSFLCLNGEWDFSVASKNSTEIEYDRKIKVPFSPETLNSNINQNLLTEKNDCLYYKKIFSLPDGWISGVTLLHFGAVDYYCEVYLNSVKVGSHYGGYTAFSFDVTKFLKEDFNEICVKVIDNTENNGGGRGKQSKNPGGIWYTAHSGIWQTVWMENMPEKHLHSVDYTCDFENNSIKINVLSDCDFCYKVFDEGNLILEGSSQSGEVILKYPFIAWSPENPKLYDIEFVCGEDRVTSYFAMRSFGFVIDANSKKRLALNGKPYFFNGLLDQGYWPDGLLTYPSDEAILYELRTLKAMGFNTLRKHIKVEPMRWYYHCDKLGFIVWQDFVNGGGEYKFNHIATFPFLGFKHRDNDYKYFSREDARGRELFVSEWKETINQLKNCVCISM